MKETSLILIAILISITGYSQKINHDKKYKKGFIITKDSSKVEGLLNFFYSHTGKLKFKKTENSEVEKYSPDEIIGFIINDKKFESLQDIKVVGAMGLYTPIKKCFGELLEKGKVSVHLIYYIGIDPFGGSNLYYMNFCLSKSNNKTKETLCLPYNQRLKKRRIEKEKEKFRAFLETKKEVNIQIMAMSRESGLAETVEIVKKHNLIK